MKKSNLDDREVLMIVLKPSAAHLEAVEKMAAEWTNTALYMESCTTKRFSGRSGFRYTVLFKSKNVKQEQYKSLLSRGIGPCEDFDIALDESNPNFVQIVFHLTGSIEEFDEEWNKVDEIRFPDAHLAVRQRNGKCQVKYFLAKQAQ